MKTIAIVNQKGGVAKTTTALALSSGLVMRGKKVLMIDLDAQCSLTDSVLKKHNDDCCTTLQILTGEDRIAGNIIHTEFGDLLQACELLMKADKLIDDEGRSFHLRDALDEAKLDYDYIIIDTPPHTGVCMYNALVAADECIVPVEAAFYSLKGLDDMAVTWRTVVKYSNPNIKIQGILLTRHTPRTNISRELTELFEKIAVNLGTKVYKTKIRECSALKEAVALRTPIYKHKPDSNAAHDYSEFVEEVLEAE